jgi:hypothetical protein
LTDFSLVATSGSQQQQLHWIKTYRDAREFAMMFFAQLRTVYAEDQKSILKMQIESVHLRNSSWKTGHILETMSTQRKTAMRLAVAVTDKNAF